jgi:hypothetical protein
MIAGDGLEMLRSYLALICLSWVAGLLMVDRDDRIAATYAGFVDKDVTERNIRAILKQH